MRVLFEIESTFLVLGGLLPRAEEFVEPLEGGLRPDDKSADMASRSQFEQIQLANADQVDSRNVAESPTQTLIFVVDDERPSALDASAIAHFTFACAETLRFVHLKTHNKRVL